LNAPTVNDNQCAIVVYVHRKHQKLELDATWISDTMWLASCFTWYVLLLDASMFLLLLLLLLLLLCVCVCVISE
jgi:hypothetical protein